MHWCAVKEYKFDNWNTISGEWTVGEKSAPTLFDFNTEWNYAIVSRNSMLSIRNGSFFIRAIRRNATYYSAFIRSKQAYTPSNHRGYSFFRRISNVVSLGRKIRYEVTARIPTIPGACPQIYLFGDTEMYGSGWQKGSIHIMSWRHEIGSVFLLNQTVSNRFKLS
jgi:hypothetical protein